ncbi:DUF2207 domain-containing protein [Olsenella sp. YH-ols2217]|uniref:DUF2207 domain-containing protein n=1 Tax=Kribbibacterium absianum TaxID=3044210 RepID=A0ABT6ZKZ1_9ACTN|nr:MULTISPECIES: DUF2207 domain-containing protein [unclassified Olsenella]MDJ1122420.1 DUF2207 domain-containing protein [Olsenella sp. YH-ols2216]MDJ1129326.1 DUF2207 domain-containing protein [Olsenella sp. YH-ols2217]
MRTFSISKRVRSAAVAVALFLAALLAAPVTALAVDYTMGPVTIDAVLAADGTLTVTEDRTFNFDGHANGVYWKIPTGTYEGREIAPVVESCGVVEDGQYERFSDSSSGDDHTYELSDYSSYTQVKLYNQADDEPVTFRVVYKLPQLATAWADTGELYWKFVSDGWDEPTDNVTCTIHLPVPSGQTVKAGDNVRAWGHGTLDGNVSFDGNDVVFTVPRVGTADYAEARVTFPVSWLASTRSSENRLDAILAEEQQWADEANARREAVRAEQTGLGVVFCAVGAGACAIVWRTWRRYKENHRALFQDEYFRDVPSADHPAVLGALYHGGSVGTEEFTATLMHVSDQGAVELNHVEYPGSFGRTKEDYQLVRVPSKAEALTSPIDRDLMRMLFERVAPKTKSSRDLHGDGHVTLLFSEMKRVAKKHPERYMDAYDDWKGAAEGEAIERGFFTDDSRGGRGWLVLAIVACALALCIGLAGAIELEPPAWVWLTLLLPVAGLVAAIVALAHMKALSREAIELRAQLEALRRWLKDFTRLKEAVPNDVILWNRLLVMAVVLGVADEVIEQLQVAMPELLTDPDFVPTYVWVSGHGSMEPPSAAFASAAAASYQASSAAIAASNNSSGGGGGGGFSGGGGGGFGGGGGGGAF